MINLHFANAIKPKETKETKPQEIKLVFDGYYDIDEVPEVAGIYCIYSYRKIAPYKIAQYTLLYIGQSDNISRRLYQHEKGHEQEWKEERDSGREIVYSYAEMPNATDRDRAEKALIYQHRESEDLLNDKSTVNPPKEATRIILTGATKKLCSDFVVKPEPEQ